MNFTEIIRKISIGNEKYLFSCATNQISDQVGILHASKSCVEISHQMQHRFSALLINIIY